MCLVMGFWSFLGEMWLFNRLFGHHKKESFGCHDSKGSRRFDDYSRYDDDYCNTNYGRRYSGNDYVQQDFDDDLDSGMIDDDF